MATIINTPMKWKREVSSATLHYITKSLEGRLAALDSVNNWVSSQGHYWASRSMQMKWKTATETLISDLGSGQKVTRKGYIPGEKCSLFKDMLASS